MCHSHLYFEPCVANSWLPSNELRHQLERGSWIGSVVGHRSTEPRDPVQQRTRMCPGLSPPIQLHFLQLHRSWQPVRTIPISAEQLFHTARISSVSGLLILYSKYNPSGRLGAYTMLVHFSLAVILNYDKRTGVFIESCNCQTSQTKNYNISFYFE